VTAKTAQREIAAPFSRDGVRVPSTRYGSQAETWEDKALTTETSTAESGTAPAPLRAVVADDETLMREGLASLLDRSGFTVVGQVGNAVELLALVRKTNPDVVVVDIRMPPTHTTEGLEAARVIREELPDTGILLLCLPTSTSSTRWSCWPAAAGSGICSRPASPTSPILSTPSSG
jgi:CheY-like chemotaxis protein